MSLSLHTVHRLSAPPASATGATSAAEKANTLGRLDQLKAYTVILPDSVRSTLQQVQTQSTTASSSSTASSSQPSLLRGRVTGSELLSVLGDRSKDVPELASTLNTHKDLQIFVTVPAGQHDQPIQLTLAQLVLAVSNALDSKAPISSQQQDSAALKDASILSFADVATRFDVSQDFSVHA